MADHHDHPPYVAHHFDNAEQQYDAGKLGIWVFLVTEILFFSGLFVAYTLYRAAHPDIFYEAHFHLDKILGGLNTIVLLFSSLTMAVAVRASQLGQNKVLITNLAITMVCAAIFLGVKAVEYSHKWDMGILTRGYYNLNEHAHHEGISKWLIILSIPPGILLIVFAAAAVVFKVTDAPKKALFFGILALMMGGYFLGAAGGKFYMDAIASANTHASGGHDKDHQDGDGKPHAAGENHDAQQKDSSSEDQKKPAGKTNAGSSDEKKDDADEGKSDKVAKAKDASGKLARGGQYSLTPVAFRLDEKTADQSKSSDGKAKAAAAPTANPVDSPEMQSEKQRRVGIFFSIYYVMTGLHAVHVIAGMIALSWLLWRAINLQFRIDYFGPVDNVGLYWHLVDLIWIFLFPLLYLIN